ncbi:MAG: murein biosynthesis integral membrane protein MurJ [Gammaproteobacteria bacterium]|nr:murein biosynthesis integral membrane protein MurJ [Gammaproteobacteria bacterium]
MSRKLLKFTVITGAMTLLSRIAGLARDIVFASLIGAGSGIAADAFYVAFRIPNFLRRIFGEGAFSQAFVPVFAEYKTRATESEVRTFVSHMLGSMGSILLLVTVVGVVSAPLIVWGMAHGFNTDPVKFDLTVTMLRIVFPYIFFISLVAMSAGILNTYQRFGVAEFTTVLLNLCLISAALFLAPHLQPPVLALAWGVFFAGAVQLLFQIPFLRKLKVLSRPQLGIRTTHEGVRRVYRLMLPAIFGSSISQVNLLVNTLLASYLITGSVSWLYYADRLMEFPLGVFGIALATVILPSLSKRHANNSKEDFSHLLDWGLRWVGIIGLPATVALIILAGPLLATLFLHGQFSEHDVRMTTSALVAFAVGLPGFMVVKVLAPAFYARQDTNTPMRIGVVAVVANILASLALFYPFGHVGLAIAVSLSAFINAGLLWHRLYRDGIYRPAPGGRLFLVRIILASGVMGLVLWLGSGELQTWITAHTLTRAWKTLLWVGIGLGVYLVGIMAVGIRPRQLLLARSEGARHED